MVTLTGPSSCLHYTVETVFWRLAMHASLKLSGSGVWLGGAPAAPASQGMRRLRWFPSRAQSRAIFTAVNLQHSPCGRSRSSCLHAVYQTHGHPACPAAPEPCQSLTCPLPSHTSMLGAQDQWACLQPATGTACAILSLSVNSGGPSLPFRQHTSVSPLQSL